MGCNYVIRKPRISTAAVAAPLTNTPPRKETDFLGAICTLYAVPTVCVIAIVYYEYNNRDKWLSGKQKPALWAFLLKFFMSLFIGASSVFWIWSMKSVNAWRSALKRMGPRKQPPVKIKTVPQVLRYMPSQTLTNSNMTATKLSSSSARAHSHRKPRVHHSMRAGNETIIWFFEVYSTLEEVEELYQKHEGLGSSLSLMKITLNYLNLPSRQLFHLSMLLFDTTSRIASTFLIDVAIY